MCSNKINSIKEILNRRETLNIAGDTTNVHAAVMMIIKNTGNSFSTLLIRRPTNDKDVFSGHMAFPGGKKMNEDENKLETAYRETEEEVGINLRNKSIVLGQLDDCNPSTPVARKFIVTPYITYLQEHKDVNINEEVSDTVWIPLLELKKIYLSNSKRYKGQIRKESFEYNYEQYFIWGLTGRILNNFFDLTNKLFE